MFAADARTAVTFSLSPGQTSDAPEGRKLLKTFKNGGWEATRVILDKAYDGLEMLPVVRHILQSFRADRRCHY